MNMSAEPDPELIEIARGYVIAAYKTKTAADLLALLNRSRSTRNVFKPLAVDAGAVADVARSIYTSLTYEDGVTDTAIHLMHNEVEDSRERLGTVTQTLALFNSDVVHIEGARRAASNAEVLLCALRDRLPEASNDG